MGSRSYGPVGTLMVGTVADMGGRVVAVEIVYETHAITEDNENGIATGWLPGRLSERGRAVAIGLGERRRDDGLAAVFTSDLDRPFPGGQGYRQVIDATRDFLAELVEAWDGERVLVIAHSANRYALQVLLDGARIEDLTDAPFTWQPGWEFTLTEAAISR